MKKSPFGFFFLAKNAIQNKLQSFTSVQRDLGFLLKNSRNEKKGFVFFPTVKNDNRESELCKIGNDKNKSALKRYTL